VILTEVVVRSETAPVELATCAWQGKWWAMVSRPRQHREESSEGMAQVRTSRRIARQGWGCSQFGSGWQGGVLPTTMVGLAFNGAAAGARLQIGACNGVVGHGAGSVG